MNHLKILREIPEFTTVPDEQLRWLIDNGTCRTMAVGDFLFRSGDPIDQLLIILEGRVMLKNQQGNQFRIIGAFEKYSISGYLPYSRATTARGIAQVTQTAEVLALPKSRFREMINTQEELTTALVHVMSTRIRQLTRVEQQNDKMMALGKLSAGLAHELNNPSAAIIRASQSLSKHLKNLPESFKQVISIRMTSKQVDAANELLFAKINAPKTSQSMMQRAALEDELMDWLEDQKVPEAGELAEVLSGFGFQVEDMDFIAEQVSLQDMPAVMHWLEQVLTTEQLVREIEDASQRINQLVSSVKSYTHMDQAPEKIATEIHTGLDNTLTMLNHKLKKNGIEIVREYDYDLPKPEILVSEINQVWTNLIDNAIDAMETSDKKILTVRTLKDGEFVNVFIADSGSGIPEEVQGKIFDPFFTTKAIGKGTGLGLEVVHQIVGQHHGSLTLESKPGHTEFKVCIPIKAS